MLSGVWKYILDGLSHVVQPGQSLCQEKRENGINSNRKSPLIARRQFPWGGDRNKIKKSGNVGELKWCRMQNISSSRKNNLSSCQGANDNGNKRKYK